MRVDIAFIPVVDGAAADAYVIADLAPREQDTIRRLGVAADRDRAATARAAARWELGRRLGIHPRRVPLVASPSGKPYVEGARIGVSWSHSGRWVALAIVGRGSVGVDIERHTTRIPTRALAMVGCASVEDFVAREAAGKVTGDGLAGSWPLRVTVHAVSAPAGYLAAVAAPTGMLWVCCQGQERLSSASHCATTTIPTDSGLKWFQSRSR
jgi:phosphopantetheinyl transferase